MPVICRIVSLSAVIVSTGALLAGCASQQTATVKRAERLVATYSAKSAKRGPAKSRSAGSSIAPADGSAMGMTPPVSPALGPSSQPPDIFKKHLLELYTGQQQIIEALEARTPEHDPAEGDRTEQHASDLPKDISQEDLLRILGQQQKLIKALTNQNAKNLKS